MGIVDRASDAARTIAIDKVCSRRLMAGTILAGGPALPGVALGPAAAADLAGGLGACVTSGVTIISLDATIGRASLLINANTFATANVANDVGGTITNKTSDGTIDSSGT